MFDLFRSGSTGAKYLLGALLLIVAASMVTYLIPNSGITSDATTNDQTVLAEVGGQKITAADAQAGMDRLVRAGQIPANLAPVYIGQYVDGLVQDEAAIYEFAKQGLTVTDVEVLSGFMTVYPQLFKDGKLISTDQLSQQLAQQGLTLEGGLDNMRRQLLLKKVEDLARASVIVTQQEVNQALVDKHRTAKIQYIAFPAAKFRDQVKVTPEALKTAYDANKNSYMIPAKRSFDALVVEQAKVEQTLEVGEAQMRAAYSASMDNFRTPERVQARHILFMTTGKSDAEKKTLHDKAEDVLKQVKGGADFAELAKKYSQDPGSAQKGGDLGFFVHGQMVPEFDKYAFAGKINDISPIVETNFGYHIIQVTAKEPAKVRPFEEVKDSIAKQLKAQNVNEKMQQLADQAHAGLLKSPTNGAEIAKQLGLQYVAAKDVAAGEAIPGIGAAPELDNALAAMKLKDVSDPIIISGNRMAVIALIDLTAARPSSFADVQDKVRDNFLSRESTIAALAASNEAARRAKAGESLDAIAKSLKVDVIATDDVNMNQTVAGLGQMATLAEAYNRPVGTVAGPVPVDGRNIVYKIVNQTNPDPSQFSYERDSAYQDLKQKKAKAAFELMQDSVMNQAKLDGKLTKYPDRISRLAASYLNNNGR